MSQTGIGAGRRMHVAVRRRANDNTESVDNYLKAIFSLGGAVDGAATPLRVPSKQLAERLGVAPASVTNMLQKLAGAEKPLVAYERHRGVQLSALGRRRALEIVRHHRLLETFLYEVLDYPLEEVHDEAERLEHFISERFEERIAAKLGDPRQDPHGHAIPTMTGEMALSNSVALNEIARDGMFVVDSVSDRDADRLKMIEACGLTPGVTLKVKKTKQEGFSVRVRGSAKEFNVSREVAADVRIRTSK